MYDAFDLLPCFVYFVHSETYNFRVDFNISGIRISSTADEERVSIG